MRSDGENRPHIVVVGSSNTDMVIRAERLPRPGETVLGGQFSLVPGGKGANQAVAAARLEAQVTFIAKIGMDLFGDQALEKLNLEGIDTSYAVQDPDHPSGVALIGVDIGTGENAITVASGANAFLSVDDVQRVAHTLPQAQGLLVQLETPLPTVEATLRLAQAAQVTTILNPAPAQALPDTLLAMVLILTPNETEALLLTGCSTPEEAARQLIARGVETVIVTLGHRGVLLVTRDTVQHIEGYSGLQVVDTTAAGDCFSGALAVAVASGKPIAQAAAYANAAAALSVTRAGAQPSMPTRAELEVFLSRFARE